MERENTPDVRELLHRRAEASPPPPAWTPALAQRVRRTRRRVRTLVGIAAASVAAAVVLGVVAVSRGDDSGVNSVTTRPPTDKPAVPRTIQVNGKVVPLAGAVPWGHAVAAGPHSRTITIFADGDRTAGSICNLPVERVAVVETSASVSVSVSGYGKPLPAGTSCAAVGHSPQPHQITLHVPLGDRPLIDTTDGSAHRVLDTSTIPAVTKVPAGLVEQPVQWDEKEDFVVRSYASKSTGRQGVGVALEYGVFSTCQCAVEHSAPNGQVVETVTIDNVSAQVWRYVDMYNNTTAVQWTPVGEKTIRITVGGSPAQYLSTAEAIAIARSVR